MGISRCYRCGDLAKVLGYTDQLLLGRFKVVLDQVLRVPGGNFKQHLPIVLHRP
ncbi:hypothetical protein [Prochlorococcus sp. MIT 0801]|uniref:hypothetical protein n=1 Tax=Prochlorococcus sp. MIT 0801 TaxID=1501269 RepID=UPI0004F6C991|nr:hypothetical protein [Prochlorococcus sp. MIT 0801]AIQ96544.1 hypothetical protein EW15_0452 [Prochlorococcus sp. MIT 0801]